jgi:hypothetical protein
MAYLCRDREGERLRRDGSITMLVTCFLFLHSMAESSYDVLFGKAARKLLFEEYYADSDKFVASLMLRPPEDPNVDFVLRVRKRSYRVKFLFRVYFCFDEHSFTSSFSLLRFSSLLRCQLVKSLKVMLYFVGKGLSLLLKLCI